MPYFRIVTPKAVNVVQLRHEMDNRLVWDNVLPDGTTEVGADVEDEATLLNAIKNHVAQDLLVDPTVQEQLDALTATLVSKGALNAADVAKTKTPRKPVR